MNIERAVKPITLTLLTLGILITAYVLWASKQSSMQPDTNQVQSSTKINKTDNIAKAPKFVPDRSKDEGLPKFTDLSKNTDDDRLSPEIFVTGGSEEIIFEPEKEMEYQQMSVVIALPDGSQIRKSFAQGEAVTIADERLKDGGYNWETTVSPKIEPSVREEMTAIRQITNIEEQQKLIRELRENGSLPSAEQVQANVQSGYFTISEGKILDGSAIEETTASRPPYSGANSHNH